MQIVMQAYDEHMKGLAAGVPLYFVVAHGPVAGRPSIPFLKQHHGIVPVSFDRDSGVGPDSVIGAYVPTGMSARFRFRSVALTSGKCNLDSPEAFSEWKSYDAPYIDRDVTTFLELGGGGIPLLGTHSCLVLQWAVGAVSDYAGNTRHLIERPTARQNGITQLPGTHVIAAEARESHGGGMALTVSEDFGAIGKTLEIRSSRGDYISILHNIGAPTDDGLVWSVALHGAKGLYGRADAPTNLGSSQFCGHPDSGSPFGTTMWGMKMPLQQLGQTLMAAHQCGGASCFVPMYSDWTSAEKAGSAGGTFPFMRPRSLHPWDAQVDRIAMEPLPSSGPQAGIVRLTYSFNYRPHLSFSAQWMRTTLWFNQALTDSGEQPRHIDVYLVRRDGTTTYLPFRFTQAPQADSDQGWAAFCVGDNEGPQHCKENPFQHNDVTCRCTYAFPDVKRVVYDYVDDGVALSLEHQAGPFSRLTVGTTFRRNIKGRPFLLTAAIGNEKKDEEFHIADPVAKDGYYLYTGTLPALNAAGLGIGGERLPAD